MWSVAPVSITQVSLLKAFLCTGFTANTECHMLKDIQSWNIWQVLPEAAVEVIAELAEWTPSQESDEKAWVLSREINC